MHNLFKVVLEKFLLVFVFLVFLNCTPDSEEVESPTTFDLTVGIEGEGSVSPQSGSYSSNETLLFKATPSTGYYFDRWLGFDSEVESEEVEVILNRNIQITAVFLPYPELSDEVLVYNPKKVDSNPVFMIENGGKNTSLTAKTGEDLQTWNYTANLGNDIELFPDGSVLGLFKPETISFSFGGYGGILKKFDSSGLLEWEYEVNSEKELLHHDFDLLPNGNILLMVWEGFSAEEAVALGYSGVGPIYLEKIIEFNPQSQEVVWEWRSADHLVQEFNEEALNYGSVANQPEKIDLNYNNIENGDLMHANGLYYDQARDVIFFSVNFYSEVWVIPHQYDTETTRGSSGDLLFRFGNPSAYKSEDERLFYNNHHPTLVEHHPDTKGNFLIYMNGSEEEQSVVYEFSLPDVFESDSQGWTTPEVVWSFTNPDLFFGKISGAYRLPNGNTLICEGDFGYWEVTPQGEVVWKYQGQYNFWRGYVYP